MVNKGLADPVAAMSRMMRQNEAGGPNTLMEEMWEPPRKKGVKPSEYIIPPQSATPVTDSLPPLPSTSPRTALPNDNLKAEVAGDEPEGRPAPVGSSDMMGKVVVEPGREVVDDETGQMVRAPPVAMWPTARTAPLPTVRLLRLPITHHPHYPPRPPRPPRVTPL